MAQPTIILNGSRISQARELTGVALQIFKDASEHLGSATASEVGSSNDYPQPQIDRLCSLQTAAIDRLTQILKDPQNWMIDEVGTDTVKEIALESAELARLQRVKAVDDLRPCRRMGAAIARGTGEWLAVFQNPYTSIIGRGQTVEEAFRNFDQRASEAISEEQRKEELQAAAKAEEQAKLTSEKKPRRNKK